MTTHVDTDAVRCAALFVSVQQGSNVISDSAVCRAIENAIYQFGVSGCIARVAEEFGDHPDTAIARMRWVHSVIDRTPARPHEPS
jgi:hypothetical protein